MTEILIDVHKNARNEHSLEHVSLCLLSAIKMETL